jgi:hypothetical protein
VRAAAALAAGALLTLALLRGAALAG